MRHGKISTGNPKVDAHWNAYFDAMRRGDTDGMARAVSFAERESLLARSRRSTQRMLAVVGPTTSSAPPPSPPTSTRR